ncbi:hypothetical protein OSTOST_05304, partial [Ostertagia ostertagi]
MLNKKMTQLLDNEKCTLTQSAATLTKGCPVTGKALGLGRLLTALLYRARPLPDSALSLPLVNLKGAKKDTDEIKTLTKTKKEAMEFNPHCILDNVDNVMFCVDRATPRHVPLLRTEGMIKLCTDTVDNPLPAKSAHKEGSPLQVLLEAISNDELEDQNDTDRDGELQHDHPGKNDDTHADARIVRSPMWLRPTNPITEYTSPTCTMEDNPKHGHLSRMRIAIFNRYCDIVLITLGKLFLQHYQAHLFWLSSLLVSTTVFDFDPVKGFETRGTTLSNARLTLDAIRKTRATARDILLAKLKKNPAKRQAKTFKVSNGFNGSNSSFREIVEMKQGAISSMEKTSSWSPSNSRHFTTLEPISIDYKDYGTDIEPKADDLSDPCVQYMALGTKIPYLYMDYTAKIILQINAGEIFSVDVLRRLCEVDTVIDRVVNSSQYKPAGLPFKNSFNLPFYSNCLRFSTANRCDAIKKPPHTPPTPTRRYLCPRPSLTPRYT